MSLEEEALREVEVAELRAALKRERQRAARAEARVEELVGAVYEAAKDAALVVGRPAPVPRPAKDRRKQPEVALLHLTDVHVGQVTPSFNPDVCEARVHKAVQKTISISEIQRADHPVRECVVMLGGDLVEGVSIFPGQAWEVESTQFEQVFRAAAIIQSAILALLESFDQVTVHEVWGNHGRLGRRGDVPRSDNLDRVVGVLARQGLAGQDRLEWEDPEPAWHRVVPVGDYRALLIHGDAIRGYSGTPAFAIAKRFTAWATGVVEPFHDGYMGHYHQEMTIPVANGRRVFMTPSLVSDSSYATEFMGANAPPGARLHFIDPKHARVTGAYVLHLD